MKNTQPLKMTLEKEILHILNLQMFEQGIITEEIYLKVKAKIEKS